MTNTENRQLRIVKVFDAPAELVWEAWTRPEHIAKWYGPSGFTITIHTMDFQEGGEWLFTMHGPDGKNYDNRNIFREIIPLTKIVFEHFNPHFFTTVLFEPKGEKTHMDWTVVLDTKEILDALVKTVNADEALKQNGEKLGQYLMQLQHN